MHALPPRPYWQDRAACSGTNDEAFFPLSETQEAADYVSRKYCNGCPVRPDCLLDAINRKSRGLWAGTDAELRTKLRKTRSRAKCPACGQRQLVRVPEAQICLTCALSWPTPR